MPAGAEWGVRRGCTPLVAARPFFFFFPPSLLSHPLEAPSPPFYLLLPLALFGNRQLKKVKKKKLTFSVVLCGGVWRRRVEHACTLSIHHSHGAPPVPLSHVLFCTASLSLSLSLSLSPSSRPLVADAFSLFSEGGLQAPIRRRRGWPALRLRLVLRLKPWLRNTARCRCCCWWCCACPVPPFSCAF